MRDIKGYEVFKESHKLALKIYKLTKSFPNEEKYGLISQMRRASYSIPMNLVEGGSLRTEKEFAHYVNRAIGSCEEIRYQLLLTKDLGYISEDVYNDMDNQYEDIKKMLYSLLKALSC